MNEQEFVAVRACQSGSPERFDELYVSYAERIYRFIFFKTLHKETAEDLTSEVFMKALERIGQFDSERGTFSSWIYRIARNAVIDHYRTRHPSDSLEDGWDVASKTDVASEAETGIALDKVKHAVQLLAPEQREVVIMRLWDGLSHAEIAEILEITESNSKQIFSRTIRKLREQLGTDMLATFLLAGAIMRLQSLS